MTLLGCVLILQRFPPAGGRGFGPRFESNRCVHTTTGRPKSQRDARLNKTSSRGARRSVIVISGRVEPAAAVFPPVLTKDSRLSPVRRRFHAGKRQKTLARHRPFTLAVRTFAR